MRFVLTAPLTLLTFLATTQVAMAAPGDLAQVDQDANPAIYNGAEATTCAWPNVVAVQTGGGLCSGTLVHPQLVMYAAHCGAATTTRIRFGESVNTSHTVNPEFCETYPNYQGTSDQGNDWAFCKLAEPITDIPITPIVFGCENSTLYAGAEVAIVGFGNNTTNESGAGTKRWALTTLIGASEAQNVGQLGGGGQASVCSGDSGGPSFVRFPDGSWHAWGIASTVSGGCGGVGTHAMMQGAIPWVEELTGLDLTPCHDADGTWNPTGTCQGFYNADPGTAFGDWGGGDWCQGTPFNAASATCGGPFDEFPDDTPPTVAITDPVDGATFPDDPSSFAILIDAADEGWGIKEIRLEIDGNDIGVSDDVLPYGFGGATFPAGSYWIVAVAEDWAGNITKSTPVGIGVGGAAPPADDPPSNGEEGGAEGSETGSAGEVGTGTGDGPSLDEGGGSSSGCAIAGNERSGGAGALMLLALAGLGRRRRRD